MAIKDKLVTNEDLKAAYDDLMRKIHMYEDITESLTFAAAAWVPDIGNTGSAGEKSTVAERIAGVKVAKVPVTKGDKYRLYGWFDLTYNQNGHYKTFPFAFADSSDDIIGVYADYPEHPYTLGTEKRVSDIHYGESRVTAPATAAYLYIFDFSGHSAIGATAGDIIVEKAI